MNDLFDYGRAQRNADIFDALLAGENYSSAGRRFGLSSTSIAAIAKREFYRRHKHHLWQDRPDCPICKASRWAAE